MAIKVNTGFSVGSGIPIDDRLVLTKEQMKNMNELTMPDSYISVCSDDNNIYIYSKDNEVSDETGKFKILTTGSDSPKIYNKLDDLGLNSKNTPVEVSNKLKDGEIAIIYAGDFDYTLKVDYLNGIVKGSLIVIKNDYYAGTIYLLKEKPDYADGGYRGGFYYGHPRAGGIDWNRLALAKDIIQHHYPYLNGITNKSPKLRIPDIYSDLTYKGGKTVTFRTEDIDEPNIPGPGYLHFIYKKNASGGTTFWWDSELVWNGDNGGYGIAKLTSDSSNRSFIEKWTIIRPDDPYNPKLFDRNANGDYPVVPFDRMAYNMFLIQNTSLIANNEYDEDLVGGWVYTTANDELVSNKEMFNKIKVVVAIPGVLRIGIMNSNLWNANPRYSECLVKWLVSDFVAYTGLKEYDIENTVLEEGQWLFIECRAGGTSWYYNAGDTEVTVGKTTYPAKSSTTGLLPADGLDSMTNNVVFKSANVTSRSAITYFGMGQYNVGSKLRTNFLNREATSVAHDYKNNINEYKNQSLYDGGLNVGLYRRTRYSDIRAGRCLEMGTSHSVSGNDTSARIYALGSGAVHKIIGKKIYAIKLDVVKPGNLTIYRIKYPYSSAGAEFLEKYTVYVRATGLQTIHLPADIILQSQYESIGIGGLHNKSTSDNISKCLCEWTYVSGTAFDEGGYLDWVNVDKKDIGFYNMQIDATTYPEDVLSSETNNHYLNVEILCREYKRSPLEDKYISFTGDSITTFAGFNTTKAGYPTGNAAGDNATYYPASGKLVNNIDATWWGILARDNRMRILRNDAWSGSRVSSSTGSSDTKCLCGTSRRYYVRNTYTPTVETTYPYGIPEIIVNMIGTNDLSGNVELGEELFKGVTGAEDEYKTILGAYSLMCRRFAGEYNKAGTKIVHFILPRGTDWGYANSNKVTIADLALHFERIAKAWGQYFIPLSYFTGFNPAGFKKLTCPTSSILKNFRGTEFENADGLHPNVVGMEIVADGVDRFLKSIV